MDISEKLKVIIVATDFSEESDKAIDFAAALVLRSLDSTIYIIHAVREPFVPIGDAVGSSEIVMENTETVIKSTRERVERTVSRLKNIGISFLMFMPRDYLTTRTDTGEFAETRSETDPKNIPLANPCFLVPMMTRPALYSCIASRMTVTGSPILTDPCTFEMPIFMQFVNRLSRLVMLSVHLR